MVRKGQHFLVDHTYLRKLVEAARLKKGDIVYEIGTGVGNLTKYIARRVSKVYTIEIDKDLYYIARDKLENFKSVFQILGDALKIKVPQDVNKIVTNPPFEITSPLINLFINFLVVEKGELVVFTCQKDVAIRILAKEGTKRFGSLSFFCRYYCNVKYLFTIPRKAYSPPPDVKISALLLKPKEGVKWDQELNEFIRKFYRQKKWDVRKVLKYFFGKDKIEKINEDILRKKVLKLKIKEVLEIYEKIKENE